MYGPSRILHCSPSVSSGTTAWTTGHFIGPLNGGLGSGFSYNGMVVDRFGNFYGATVHGGTDGDGCVYKFTP